nr:helix-turn-helix domain-containing protein [Spelaeicoccus albus]
MSRGIRVLEVLAGSETALNVREIADELGVHRSIAYRLVQTLEQHSLVTRHADARFSPGTGLAVLARSVQSDLTAVAGPALERAANDLGMTAFIVVADGDQCVTLLSAEPRDAPGVLAQRPGTVHSALRGAPGLAMMAASPDVPPARSAEIGTVRADGYAASHDEVIPGLSSVAVPLPRPVPPHAAIAVVYVASTREVPEIAARLTRAVAEIP